ncbi:hypothetical protein [Pseudomonas sp. A-RE-26]|jgi:hypothetical protein|uniref:hypothetical protein n=1 Tax=Pseudomonas TaxID=286 RepID=UPI001CBDE3DD|nr:hypothetical protein [Pseudomonas sp. A-RE-26]
MSSTFSTVADLAGEIILPDELQRMLSNTRRDLEVAGGLGRIQKIADQTRRALNLCRLEGKFSVDDIDLVERRINAAIDQQRAEWFD